MNEDLKTVIVNFMKSINRNESEADEPIRM